MSYIARTDGTREQLDTVPRLKEAQKIIGGYVERVAPRHDPSVIFLCDEEGLMKDKPINQHGCDLYGTHLHGTPIVGDIIVMTRPEAAAAGWL